MMGARIGFFQGDVKTLMEDIKELQPTLFPSVPRLLNRFYDKVKRKPHKYIEIGDAVNAWTADCRKPQILLICGI